MTDETVSKRTANTSRLTPWKPGQSGNPNGRPKKVMSIAKLAEESGEKALKQLVKLIDSTDERVSLQAAMAVLDRAVGKPKATVETTTKKEVADYSESELIALARLGSPRTAAENEGQAEPHRIQ